MSKIFWCFILFAVIVTTIVWFPPFYNDSLLVNNIILSGFSFFATILGIITIKSMGLKGDRAKSLLLLVLGIGFWFIADFTWGVELKVRGSVVYPAVSDYIYLLGYIAIFLGLLKEIRMANLSWEKINKRLLAFSSLISLVIIACFSYFSIFVAYRPESPLAETIVTIGYGVGDIILTIMSFFIILLMWAYRGGKLSRIWLYLLACFLLEIIADSAYAYFTSDYEANVNPITNLINLFYNGSYILIGIYFVKLKNLIQDVQLKAVK